MEVIQVIERLEGLKEDKLRNIEQAMRQNMKSVVKDQADDIKALAFAIEALKGLQEANNRSKEV